MSGVPHELQKNLSGLAAAAIHDGADDFFPLRPGNIEIGGKDLVEPLKRTQHSKKAVVDAQARRAGVAALELSVLMELHGGTYATGKQLSDAISVSLQLLLRSKEGKLSKIQKHVRDILLRIVSADLSVPETFKSGYTIIAMLLYDLKKGQLSLDKYREKLAVLSRKDILNAYSGVAMNNNNQNHVSVAGKNATGSGRNQVGKVRSDDNLNEFNKKWVSSSGNCKRSCSTNKFCNSSKSQLNCRRRKRTNLVVLLVGHQRITNRKMLRNNDQKIFLGLRTKI